MAVCAKQVVLSETTCRSRSELEPQRELDLALGVRRRPSEKMRSTLGSSSYMRLVLACPANMQTFRFGY